MWFLFDKQGNELYQYDSIICFGRVNTLNTKILTRLTIAWGGVLHQTLH